VEQLLSPEVIEDLRHGRATIERKMAVCSQGAHLAPVDRVEILAVLAHDPDELISTRAFDGLANIPPEVFVAALSRETVAPQLYSYATKTLADKAAIVDAMLGNKNCPGEYLAPLVARLSAAAVRSLMEELDRISGSSALAHAMEHSPHLTADHKNILQELRSAALLDPTRLSELAAEAEPDPVKRVTLLQQVSRMNVSQRVQFAMKGSGEARRALIRDSNKVVQRAVLQSPRLTEQEVEAYASMTNLTDEILRLIATNRNFRKNYTVVRNLMNNPKTPLDVTLHMLPMLNAVDLKKLTSNKNVPETLRTTAIKLQRTRVDLKK
jgi:hypothetical protein